MNTNTNTNTNVKTEISRGGNMVLLPILLSLLIAGLAFNTGCSRETPPADEPIVTAVGPAAPAVELSQVSPVAAAAADTTHDATPNLAVPAEPVIAKADPTTVKGWVREGRAAMDGSEFKVALAAADKALAIAPDSAQALHLRGRARLALKHGDEALSDLQKARELAPENGYIANTLGYALIQTGRAADAVPHLEAARERLPEVAYVRNNLGVAYERSGERAKAIDEYRAGVAAGDPDGKAALSLARLGAALTPDGEATGTASVSVNHE